MLAMLNRRQFVTAVRARSTGGSRNRKPVRGAKCLTDSIRPLRSEVLAGPCDGGRRRDRS